ncbi:MAG: hypothetical protein EZS28_047489, partial [Streblomastix strix]
MKSVNKLVQHSCGLKGWAFIGYLLIAISVQAKDYYVAPTATGAGDGSDVADAADITTLKTFLSGYHVATDPDLNIYFSAGTYIMDNVPFTFASNENNRSGLNVVFQPLNNDAVVLSGGGSVIRLLNMGSAKNETSPLTVSIRNMAIVNFYSTGAADNGTNSLFTLGDYNVLNLEVDSIDNISSNRLPLFLMGTSTAKDSYTTVHSLIVSEALSSSRQNIQWFAGMFPACHPERTELMKRSVILSAIESNIPQSLPRIF